MNNLQEYANDMIAHNWTISSMTDSQFVATKKKNISPIIGIFGIIGLFAYLVPGLLLLLIGYVARGTDTRIVTATDADIWAAQHAEKRASAAVSKQAWVEERQNASGLRRIWLGIAPQNRATVVVMAVIAIFFISLVIYALVS